MEFDTADLARMELDGSLENVIFHEMGHVIGMGTIWEEKGLLEGAGTINPVFTGANAMREFAALIGADSPRMSLWRSIRISYSTSPAHSTRSLVTSDLESYSDLQGRQ